MRHQRSLNVWPAFADLMTVLAVVGLFTAIEMRRTWAEEKARLEEKIENEEMFEAIQQIQAVINEISRDESLTFGIDQSLQFGDDLVGFELNSVEPKWKGDGVDRLRRFCQLVSREMSGYVHLFTVHVEGHTDSTPCKSDPNCNWWLSSNRAAAFVALMRDDEHCPGGRDWELRPIGFADTKPFLPTPEGLFVATRRIAVRVVPNYELILND